MSKGFLAWVLLMVLLALLPRCFAKDVGVLGPTYPILEENFLSFIEKRVQALTSGGQWQSLQSVWQQQAQQYRDRPVPMALLPRARHNKTWRFDPSVVLSQAIITPDGLELIPKGARMNPLDTHELSRALIFLDGDNPAEQQWALTLDQELKGKDKIILLGGSLLNAEKQFKKAIYFDQGRRLIRHFGVTHTPAWIVQEKNYLLIHEVVL